MKDALVLVATMGGGLGCFLLGMKHLSEGLQSIGGAGLKRFMSAMTTNRFAGLMTGVVSTVIVQSSSIITVMTVGFVSSGLMDLTQAVNVIIGSNIGTTATAWLAAAGGSTEARRTAMAHTLFNVAGTVILMPLFIPVVLPAVKAFFPEWAAEPAAPMAAVHTGFNIVTTLCFLPFTGPFAALVKRIVKERKDAAEVPRLVYLDAHMKMSPFICCSQAYQTMHFMAESVKDMLEGVRAVLEGDAAPETEQHIFHREDILDRVQCEVTEFLGKVMSARLPASVAEYARALLRIADEYESLSDELPVIVRAYRRIRSGDAPWYADSRAAVLGILENIDGFQQRVCAAFMAGKHLRESVLAELSVTSKDLRHAIRAARESQLQRIGSAESAPLVALATLDIFNALDRARSCLINIAETLAGGKRFLPATMSHCWMRRFSNFGIICLAVEDVVL